MRRNENMVASFSNHSLPVNALLMSEKDYGRFWTVIMTWRSGRMSNLRRTGIENSIRFTFDRVIPRERYSGKALNKC
jgi:hypothetical protein